MSPKLKKILLNNWTITVILGFLVILIFNPIKNKFRVHLDRVETYPEGMQVYYNDLDMDGNSERIHFQVNQEGMGSVKIYNPNHLGQIDAKNRPCQGSRLVIFSDTDGDLIKEIYFPGIRNDSIFINKIDFDHIEEVGEFFIEKIKPDTDFRMYYLSSVDLDGNNYKELIVAINAGYTLQPRKIYVLDPFSGEILKTPFSGAKVNPEIFNDLNGDGLPEIICGTFATENYKNQVAYSDSFAWIFVFNNKLEFLFDPVKISSGKASAEPAIFQVSNKNYIFVQKNLKDNLSLYYRYCIIDSRGKMVKEDSIKLKSKPETEYGINTILTENGRFGFFTHEGDFYEFDGHLKPVKAKTIKDVNYPYKISEFDLNGDGNKELIFRTQNSNELVFLDPKMKHLTRLIMPDFSRGIMLSGIRYRKSEPSQLFFQEGEHYHLISYEQNPLWNFRFLIWAFILTGIYFLLRFLQFIQKQRIKAQLQTQQQIREMQFKIISSQLNPHFTFNTLSSISSALYDPKKPEIYDLFVKFTGLIRTTMSDANKVARTLLDELKFTGRYLEIQNYRFKGTFTYHIGIENNAYLKLLVPKMIIQIFVENSIKHGFRGLSKPGHIEINVSGNNQFIRILITDNGIGRLKAKELSSDSSGLGIRAMSEYIDLLNKKNFRKIHFQIIDLMEGNNAAGTKVEIEVPVHFDYEITL